jgi:hypothetical protein
MASLVFAGSATGWGSVQKRLNMLRPARWPYSGESPVGFSSYVTSWSGAANYFKDWVVFNLQANGGADTDTATFGAFTTAPDATEDTARLLVDTTANTQHAFLAGWSNVNQTRYGKLRLTGCFKYAGRRIVLVITTAPASGGGAGTYGCKAVFDLLNGQVAVANAAFGTATVPWVIYPAQIRHIGGGWYNCSIEAECNTSVIGSPNASLYGKVMLDNGTGTAAESSSYAGDGSSGVYGWRSNMLPSRAWDLGTTVFFDDFDDDDMENIDLTNSRVSGFDWYINNVFPGYDGGDLQGNGNVPTVPATLSVADSVLTCSSHPLPLFLSTFASQWDVGDPYTQSYVGRGWVPPALFEARAKWDISQSDQNDAVAFWTAGLEWLVAGRNQDPDSLLPGIEVDFFEALRGEGPEIHVIYYEPGPDPFSAPEQAVGIAGKGLDVWYAAHTYGTGRHVERLGTAYTALRPTVGDAPESSALDWGPYDDTTSQKGAAPPVGDYTNFHNYATLWFPYNSDTGEPGQIVHFYDGAMISFPITYGPGLTATRQSELLHPTDGQQMPVFLGCGPDMGMSYDWVRVTK